MQLRGQSVSLTGLRKRLGNREIIRDVSLDIRPGEFVTLLGPSGCGKSTLLRLIAGFDAPDEGTIAIGERDVRAVSPKDRDLAMVFQSYALYPHMSVADNIAIPLTMRRLSFLQRAPGLGRLFPSTRREMRDIRAEVGRVAAMLGMTSMLDRLPSQLSGGQRQRVAVGRALARSPGVFLMDEPLSNLDAALKEQIREELTELHRRTGITFIYVTHDQAEAMSLSDRIAVMENGEILQYGTPEALLDAPSSLAVARFIGTVPMNIVEVSVRSGMLFSGDQPLRIRSPELTDGQFHLGVRPEALSPVAHGTRSAHFRLPLAHIERSGSGALLRCDGSRLGTPWIRLFQPLEKYQTYRSQQAEGVELPLRISLGEAHVFAADGRRLEVSLHDAAVEEVRHGFGS